MVKRSSVAGNIQIVPTIQILATPMGRAPALRTYAAISSINSNCTLVGWQGAIRVHMGFTAESAECAEIK